jgi:hypothetical protein
VEDEYDRKIISPKALLKENYFWTVDCALFRSMERLLREVPESVSVRALTKTLSQSIGLPTGVLLSRWDLHDALNNLIFAKREVGEICIDEKQRRTDLKWIVQVDHPSWITPVLDWPPPSNNVSRLMSSSRRRFYLSARGRTNWIEDMCILRSEAPVVLTGIKDEMIVSAFGNEFLLISPLQAFFAKDIDSLSVETNDVRWVLLSMVRDNLDWIGGPAHADRVLEEFGKSEGVWDHLLDYGGEAAAAEITAFRVAARESSWKRFGAALWIRGDNE